MERYIEKLRSCQTDESPKSILNMLDDKVKQDFHEMYELMNGMPLHAGVQVGIRLAEKLK